MSTFDKKSSLPLLALWTLVVSSPSARADSIVLGQTIPGPSNAVFSGGTLLASVTTPASTAAFSGTATSAVVSNAGGTLDFYFQLASNASSIDSINRLSGFNFDKYTTDVFNITNGSAIGSLFVNGTIDSLTADRSANGSTVGFNYGSLFLPGTTSLVLEIRTNATSFTVGNLAISAGVNGNASSFQPSGVPLAVPEPASLLLLGIGLTVVAAGIRRRHSARSE
jgi:hypothetical protein